MKKILDNVKNQECLAACSATCEVAQAFGVCRVNNSATELVLA